MKPSTGLLFSGSIDKDPRPPFSSALGASNQPAWTSIVFHQPVSGAAIYCAKLKADVAVVPTVTPSIAPSSATPSIAPSKTPSSLPSTTNAPSNGLSINPTVNPSFVTSIPPSIVPSSKSTSNQPTTLTSIAPSSATPSITPTKTPATAPGQGFYYQADIKKEQTAGANGNFQMLINTNGTASYKWSLDLSNLALSSTLTNGGCTLDYIQTYGLKCKVYKTYSYLNLPIISLY